MVGDEKKYNAAAAQIMQAHHIHVNDLHAFVNTLPDDCKRKANVHYTQVGSRRMGQEVAMVIANALAELK